MHICWDTPQSKGETPSANTGTSFDNFQRCPVHLNCGKSDSSIFSTKHFMNLMNLPCEKASGINKQLRRHNAVVVVTRHIVVGPAADVCPMILAKAVRFVSIPRKFSPFPHSPTVLPQSRAVFTQIPPKYSVQI